MSLINNIWRKRTKLTNLTIGYLRVSTEKQIVDSQRLAILEYAAQHKIIVNGFIEITVSSTKSTEHRKVDELLQNLKKGDIVIVSELSRLGRSTIELLTLIKKLLDIGIRLIIIKQNFNLTTESQDVYTRTVLTIFSLFSEVERDLITQRTKEGLIAARSKGIILGKPKGTIQPSKFDKWKKEIINYHQKGLPYSSIAKLLGLKSYIGLKLYAKKKLFNKESKFI